MSHQAICADLFRRGVVDASDLNEALARYLEAGPDIAFEVYLFRQGLIDAAELRSMVVRREEIEATDDDATAIFSDPSATPETVDPDSATMAGEPPPSASGSGPVTASGALETSPPELDPDDPRPDPFAPGQRVDGFRILEEIGRGGMSRVFRARQGEPVREVALKVLLEGASERSVSRFLREIQAFGDLRHPGIVPVYQVGRCRGRPWLAMELVEGRDLKALLEEDELDRRARMEVLAGAARALGHAGEQGIVHRDVKPGNILVDEDGRARVTDFGLARRLEDDEELTREGALLGTPPYAAPEQMGSGDPVDHRSDVYGLGATMYRVLTGRPPYRTKTVTKLVARIIEGNPTPPRDRDPTIPRDLEVICLKAMARLPSDRYATADEMADDLERWRAGEPIRARPLGPAERTVRWVRAGGWPRVGGIALVVLVLAGGGWGVTSWLERRAARERREAARTAYEEGRMLQANAQVRAAIPLLEDAVSRDPTFADAWYDLGICRKKTGDLEGAETALTRALEQDPDHVNALNDRSVVRKRLGRLEEALADLDRYLEIRPDSPIALNNRANLLLHLNRRARAYRDIQRALDLDPRFAFAHVTRGVYLRWLGEREAALEAFRRALEVDPDCWLAHLHVGRHHGEDRRYAEARDAFGRAIALAPDRIETHLGRARARLALDEVEGARRDVEAALELQPDGARALAVDALVRLAEDRRASALVRAREARDADPDEFLSWLALERALRANGEAEEAEVAGRRRAELAGNPAAGPIFRPE